jgi:hypothetical protein
MRVHYLACIQYVLVCVGYVKNISYDIIEYVLLILYTTRVLASCAGLLNLTVSLVISLLSDHPNKLVLREASA